MHVAYILIGTIIFTRGWIYLMREVFRSPNFTHSSPTIKGIKLHHYMYGIVIILAGFLLQTQWIIAIGLGLFIDEIAPLIKYGNSFHWKEYWSLHSFLWMIVSLVIIFIYSTV